MPWNKKQKSNKQPQKENVTSEEQNGQTLSSPTNHPATYKLPVTNNNMLFALYYQEVNQVCKDSTDWKTMIDTFLTPLPTTFRLTMSDPMFSSVECKLKASFTTFLEQISWLPSTFKLRASKQELRREPLLKEFHKWLVGACDVGEATRQELVSMLPPVMLEVEPWHRVLDLCAAPGSKTSQLVEFLLTKRGSGSWPESFSNEQSSCISGYVVANEVNRNRAHMLVHHVKRLGSPGLIVCSHDGTLMPNVICVGEGDKWAFDRVLADVPCSGDGTLRKNGAVWEAWSPVQGIGLHSLQVRLLERALSLIDPVKGGRVVYSTCSMNPVENEAVVAELMRRHTRKFKILDGTELAAKLCPGLRTRPGMTSWRVMLKNGQICDSWDQIPEDFQHKVPKSCFADSGAENVLLDKCLRIMPQDQDTGAFFLAVLEVFPKNDVARVAVPMIVNSALMTATMAQWQQDDPPFRPVDPQILTNIFSFYGIEGADNDSSSHKQIAFISRSRELKTINALSASFARYFDSSTGSSSLVPADSLHIVNAGVRCFDYFESTWTDKLKCPYRPVGEGLQCLLPLMTKRVWQVDQKSMIALLSTEDGVPRSQIQFIGDSISTDTIESGGGAVVFEKKTMKITKFDISRMTVAVMLTGTSIKAFVPKMERPGLLAHLLDSAPFESS